MSEIFDLSMGNSPLILSQPHAGLKLSPGMDVLLTEEAATLPDTDWHMPELYSDIAKELDATVISAQYSRFVVDLNRNPEGASLYPGQDVTELCPTTLFDAKPIYQKDQAPDKAEIEHRKSVFWRPYHAEIVRQIERIHRKFGYVILYDCHSIRSVVPRFFDGTLPDLNLGTADHSSCAPEMIEELSTSLEKCPFSHVLNGRFKGGYITRTYGCPANNVHALQMEIAQKTYMQEKHPFAYDLEKAERLQTTLRHILSALLGWGRQKYGNQ